MSIATITTSMELEYFASKLTSMLAVIDGAPLEPVSAQEAETLLNIFEQDIRDAATLGQPIPRASAVIASCVFEQVIPAPAPVWRYSRELLAKGFGGVTAEELRRYVSEEETILNASKQTVMALIATHQGIVLQKLVEFIAEETRLLLADNEQMLQGSAGGMQLANRRRLRGMIQNELRHLTEGK